jgi:RNA polymerase sigma-70 factor (ECF subfamily)
MGETENNPDNADSHMGLQAALQAKNELTDDELVTAVVAGDETAFETLFKRHRLQVGRVAGRFFRRREQVEEIVQDSFTKAYFALKDYSGGREKSFIAWLTRIAVNTCYDELRRANRLPKTTSHGDLSAEEATWIESRLRAVDAASDVEEATVTRDLADKLLSRLAPDDRLVLTLLNAEELSVAEIAEATGWSVAKVKVRAHRARVALRKVLRKLL